jgi:hypothetical protein
MRKLLYFLFFSLITLSVFSQERGYLEFAGRCSKNRQPIKGATVAIYKNGTKVTDLATGKNGKFQFFLDFGTDYKVTFSYTGCADMYLMIYASKCPYDKGIFPIYDGDVPFFEYNNPTINYPLFKNPFTKINYDGKKTFGDDEPYVKDFLEKLLIDPEEINKKNVQLAIEKEKLEMEAKLKRDGEEKERQEQLAEAQRKAQEEADRIKKLADEQARANKKNNESKNQVVKQEEEPEQTMATEEIQLTIDKEKRNIKEKQNKAIRSTYESDLLKIVATNERKEKEGQFTKNKDKTLISEVIETLKKDAEVKARSEQVMFDFKMRNKQVILNRGIKNKEMLTLIRQTAFNERDATMASIKKFPEANSYKPKGLVGISSDVDKGTFKTTYTYTISSGNNKTIYRRENFNWGLNYYYKNDKEISELDYLKEIAQYNIH